MHNIWVAANTGDFLFLLNTSPGDLE